MTHLPLYWDREMGLNSLLMTAVAWKSGAACCTRDSGPEYRKGEGVGTGGAVAK